MTLLEPYQNGHGKGIGVGGIRCAVKLVKPLFNECLNERIVHYSKKNNNKTNKSMTKEKSDKLKVKEFENKKSKSKKSENKISGKCKIETCNKKTGKCKNNKTCVKIKRKVKKDYLD